MIELEHESLNKSTIALDKSVRNQRGEKFYLCFQALIYNHAVRRNSHMFSLVFGNAATISSKCVLVIVGDLTAAMHLLMKLSGNSVIKCSFSVSM